MPWISTALHPTDRYFHQLRQRSSRSALSGLRCNLHRRLRRLRRRLRRHLHRRRCRRRHHSRCLRSRSTQTSAVRSTWLCGAVRRGFSIHGPLGCPLTVCCLLPGPLSTQRRSRLASAGNLFLTGGAGVGKSFTLRTIIEALKQRHGERHVAVCAATGTASVHVDGQTLHSLAGIGVPIHVTDFGKLWRSHQGQKAEAWRQTKVLILDEVSMVDAEYLDRTRKQWSSALPTPLLRERR
jgi:hypothetical protein